MAKPSASLGRFKQAVAWFRERVPLTQAEADDLKRRTGERAFTVAHVSQLKLVSGIYADIDKALAEGMSFEAFRERQLRALKNEWEGTVANPSARLETIFRTNMQSAYSAGRVREMREPDTLAVRPFWLFSAVADMRTTEVCKACDKTVLPADAGWWRTHTPPLHFNCRSAIRAITAEDARRRGGVSSPPQLAAEAGFGAIELPEPDVSEVAPELLVLYRGKRARRQR